MCVSYISDLMYMKYLSKLTYENSVNNFFKFERREEIYSNFSFFHETFCYL